MRCSIKPLVRFILFSLFLSACNQNTDEELPTATTQPPSTISISKTYTSIYLPNTPTSTPIPCSPDTADYCVVDGTFLLMVPIVEPGTKTIDRVYAYGSTAGGTRIAHHGVEFYNASGTPVLAAADGKVVFTGNDELIQFSAYLNFYGNLVILEHNLPGKTLYTLYAHLSKQNVTTGQSVSAGDKIAEVGSSGSAIGSHLHFEVRLDAYDETSTLNPELWLIPEADNGCLSMRFTDESGQVIGVQVNIQFFPDRTGSIFQSWQPEAYAPEIFHGYNWENVTLGNLTAGHYRITYFWEGVLFERWVEILPGKLTLAAFEVH